MDWSHYFYNKFPREMARFTKMKEPYKCPHHNIPQHLAFFADRGKISKEFGPEFYIAWFGLSLIDQVIHSHLGSNHPEWTVRFGEHPVPMRGAGLSCLRWDNPVWLLEKYASFRNPAHKMMLQEFLFFLNSVTSQAFGELNLDYQQLIEGILADKDFKKRFSPESRYVYNFYRDLKPNNLKLTSNY